MTHVIVHPGMGKSATTAINDCVSEHRGELLRCGVLYPDTGRYPGRHIKHNALFMSALASYEDWAGPWPPRPPCDLQTYAAELAQEIAQTQASHVLLSGEVLWSGIPFAPSALQRLRLALGDVHVSVLIALRDPVTHAESHYKQWVRGPHRYWGGTAEYLREQTRRRMWDYRRRLDEFASVFGASAIRAYWYEDAMFDATSPLAALLPTDAAEHLRNVQRLNVSPGWSVIRMLSLVNGLEDRQPKLRGTRRMRRAVQSSRLLQQFPDEPLNPFHKDEVASLRRTGREQRQLVPEAQRWWAS